MKKLIKESIQMFFAPLVWLKKFLYHSYFAIRYGEWDYGVYKVEGASLIEFDRFYYDGNHVTLYIGKYYIGVSY